MEIVIKVNGGLGNQMFQYALLCVFRQKGIKAYLDNIELIKKGNQHNGYELYRVFNINETYPKNIYLKYVLLYRLGHNRITRKILPFTKKYFYYEKNVNFKPEIITYVNGYLSGYWQSEKYFAPISNIIRNAFCFLPDNNKKNNILKQKIFEQNSVSVHIRRGDYLNSNNFSAFGGICTDEYYQRAMDYIEKKVDCIHYYIFSNDTEYIKSSALFENKEYTIVDWNTDNNSFRDMELMSHCKHNIIANSSFSWWGAWLNNNINKIILTPQKWINNDNNFLDIIPDGWIKI